MTIEIDISNHTGMKLTLTIRRSFSLGEQRLVILSEEKCCRSQSNDLSRLKDVFGWTDLSIRQRDLFANLKINF